MNSITRYSMLWFVCASAALSGCSKGPATQAEANVAQQQAIGAESVSAAQGNLAKTETSSDQSNAAATFRVASAEATSAHDVAIAGCAEKPVTAREECINSANDALTAANQKAAVARTTADNAKPATDSTANSGN